MSTGKELDAFVSAYTPEFAYARDNELMMNAYPARVMRDVRGGSLLELGIGHGMTTRLFSAHFARHVVIEASGEVIELFRTDSGPSLGTEIVQCYFETFETDERFDVIVAGFVLEHVADPHAILAKYKSFLKEGGALYAAVPNAASMHRRLANLAGMLPDMMALGAGDLALGHVRSYTPESFRAELARAGYAVEWIEGLYLKPLTTGQLASLDLDPRIYEALVQLGFEYPQLSAGMLAKALPQ